MKHINLWRGRPFTVHALALVLGCALTHFVAGQETKPAAPSASIPGAGDADKSWQQLIANSQPPTPPVEWQSTRPSEEEVDKFKAREGERVAKAAASAKDFQARFPSDPRVEQAREKEHELLQTAFALGNTNVLDRLETVEQARLKDPKLSEDERFRIRAGAVDRKAMSRLPEGRAAAFAELERGARALIKEFPKRQEGYEMLLAVAGEAEPDKARELAKILSEGAAPEEIKARAKDLLEKTGRVGKPVPIKFAAVDGRQVDMEKLRGKVVLIDFWATWCGPCVAEIPNVRSTYEKLHPKGFEIVGISFDREKDKLTRFVEAQKMTWPQYFDGKQWDNVYGKQFGIQSIPSMWLVDKKGNLRDLNARENLADKVEKLLAESL